MMTKGTLTPMYPSWTLPDPDTQPDFYSDTPVKRLIAWLVDTVLIALICVLILPFTAFTGLFFFPFLMLVVGFFYRWFTIASRSSTWGMRLMAVEFRRGDGQLFDAGTAFLHTLGLTISFALPVLQLISVAMMLFSPRRQGLTDHMLGTVAVNRRAVS
ncbi:RDD family protein [Pseudooceanicola sp. 502str34]